MQYSLIRDGSCGITNGVNGNLTGDPNLGTLTGSPAYYPLNAGSFAINAGDNALALDAGGSTLTTDQPGNTRIAAGTVDMGAYEVQCPTFPHTVPASDVGDLVFSITCANANTTDDVINLTNSTYTLTAINNSDDGLANGLPSILSAATAGMLTINGNNATITRDGSAPDFRLFYLNSGANLTLDSLTLSNGRSIGIHGGGAIRSQGTLTITNSTFSGNLSTDEGGGIINNGGTLIVTNSTFSSNSSTNYGGGISVEGGTVTVTDSIFTDNTSQNGGGIFIGGGTLTVSGSTFSGNTGTYFGGGLAGGDGTATVTNSTFSGNMAEDGGGLAGVGTTVTVTNSTFAENSATDGGSGVYNGNGTLTLNNSIVADSTSGSNCYREGGTINAHNSLIEGGLGCTNGTSSNNLTSDPSLGTLTGSPAYYPLNSDSLAINTGDNALAVDADSNSLTTDQPGNTRIVAGIVDMGAYEVQFADCPAFPVTVPASASGLLTFAITCANSNGAGTNDVINLTNSTYTLTVVNNGDGGFANGLPAIVECGDGGHADHQRQRRDHHARRHCPGFPAVLFELRRRPDASTA